MKRIYNRKRGGKQRGVVHVITFNWKYHKKNLLKIFNQCKPQLSRIILPTHESFNNMLQSLYNLSGKPQPLANTMNFGCTHTLVLNAEGNYDIIKNTTT